MTLKRRRHKKSFLDAEAHKVGFMLSNNCRNKYFVNKDQWLDRMLHNRADPTNAMIGCDNSQTRSPWGAQVKRLTKICWHLICYPHHPILMQGRFKPCFGPGYFLLQLSNCIMETCMLLAGVRVHEHL